MHLLNVFSGEELYYKYPHGDEVYNIDVVYYANRYCGEVAINEESLEHAFFAMQEIPYNVSPPQVPLVEFLKTKFELIKLSIDARATGIYSNPAIIA